MSSQVDQRDVAREAARMLWEKGIKEEIPVDPRTRQYADAALSELERLHDSTPGILKDVLDGAEIGATQLDVDPMHGLADWYKTQTISLQPLSRWGFVHTDQSDISLWFTMENRYVSAMRSR